MRLCITIAFNKMISISKEAINIVFCANSVRFEHYADNASAALFYWEMKRQFHFHIISRAFMDVLILGKIQSIIFCFPVSNGNDLTSDALFVGFALVSSCVESPRVCVASASFCISFSILYSAARFVQYPNLNCF